MSESQEYPHGKPTDGMCCLCTYEDITEEDQNYGKCSCDIGLLELLLLSLDGTLLLLY